MSESKQTVDGVKCDVNVDKMMRELGQAGQFHLWMYVLVALAAIQVGLLHTTYIFLAGNVPYRCLIPECEAANSTEYNPLWLESALVESGRQRYCSIKVPLEKGVCQPGRFSDELRQCDQWLYESWDTIVSEFNLACQEWKRTLVGTIHNIGMLVSLPIFGYISDRWGRKRSLILSCSLLGAIGTLKAFSISYEMYVIVEFLETVAGASAFPAAYVLTIELLGQDKRVLTTAFLGIMLVIGGLSFALLAKSFPYWRTFILVVYPPSLLFLSYIYFLPESIRWLLSKGRKEEAFKIVTKAAKMNKVTLSDETIQQLTCVEEKIKKEDKKETEDEKGLWVQVLKSPIIMTRLAICSWWWITCTFVFYGLAINSVSLAGDKYTNYMLVVSVEIIAVVTNALVLDRIGRKRTLLIAYLVCGISCVAIAFVPKDLSWLATLLYLVGKIAITQAFSGIYMYTSELFPTHARQSLLGFCSMIGRIGSIVAPQMPLLAIYVDWLPSVLFGSTALIAGGLMMTTPETLNTKLPDTIKEAEYISVRKIVPNNKDLQVTSKF